MEKEFIPYEQALELKELGFDEPCLKFKNNISNIYEQIDFLNWNQTDQFVSIPTISQVLKWFRKKYDILSYIDYYTTFTTENEIRIYYFIIKTKDKEIQFDNSESSDYTNEGYKTYEEAELACLKKLIEIVGTIEHPKHPSVISENGNELLFDKEGNLIKELHK